MLYQEELMDHYKYPRNNKPIENPDFSVSELNPSCGDRIDLPAGKEGVPLVQGANLAREQAWEGGPQRGPGGPLDGYASSLRRALLPGSRDSERRGRGTDSGGNG